jgi:hypothetical protein
VTDADRFAESIRRQTDAIMAEMGMRIAENLYALRQWDAMPWWKKAYYRAKYFPRQLYWTVRSFFVKDDEDDEDDDE